MVSLQVLCMLPGQSCKGQQVNEQTDGQTYP